MIVIRRSLLILCFVGVCLSLTASAQPSSTAAAEALWGHSDSATARRFAQEMLAKHPKDVDASFVNMEAAAIQDDAATTLESALNILANADGEDPRREIAIARIRSLAANSRAFRDRVASVRQMSKEEPLLRAALVNAAADGLDQYDLLAESREAGLVTDWRMAGPFGERSAIDYKKRWSPETDGLKKPSSGRKKVESLQFPTGLFTLPGYLPRQGVFYAAGSAYVDATGDWNLFLDTPGLASLTLDGRQVISHDEMASASRTERVTLHLTQGEHSILVKFTSDASPFRVALMPPSGGQRRKRKFPIATSVESDYVQASLEYWRGDLVSAAQTAQRLLQAQPSSVAHHLMAEIWRATSPDAPEALAAEIAAVNRDASAAAPLLRIAQHDFDAENTESALRHLRRALQVQPRSERAVELEAEVMSRLRWQPEATAAFERWIEIHPSCRALQRASGYFASVHEFGRARAAEARLGNCSLDSLALSEALGARGEHAAAADAARHVSEHFQLDRDAREREIREALLAKQFDRAQQRAMELAELAPNMPAARELLAQAKQRSEFTDNSAQRKWLDQQIVRLHRDAADVMAQAAQSKLSAGTFVLLNDEAVLEHAGQRWHYRHRITRLATREAIVNRGEVSIPSGASVLVLRSISSDGAFTEPELSSNKATISMPALAPGSSIEEEYVWRGTSGSEFRFAFGSFDSPIALTRFTLISDSGIQSRIERGAPAAAKERLSDGSELLQWEASDLAQAARETAMLSIPVLPAVVVGSFDDSLTSQRLDLAESMIESAAPGPRASLLAERLQLDDEFETVRGVYRTTMEQIRNDDATLDASDVPTAEDSLQDGDGNRAAVLLALAEKAKVHVELYALRSQSAPDIPNSYNHPVAVFRLQDGRQILADLESDGLPIGVISPELVRDSALPIVSADSRGIRVSDGPLEPLQSPQISEQSKAAGDVWIDSSGTLRAKVDITMGSWRGAQIRHSLLGMSAGARQSYFQQLATRLFPGCGNVLGRSENERSPERPLKLHIECTAEDFVEVRRGTFELDSIMPPLSLKNLYGSSTTRKYPLYVGSVLNEITDFRLHLPEGMELLTTFKKDLKTSFGTYSYLISRENGNQWRLVRSFDVPIQRISPERYPEFATFADQSQRTEEMKLEIAAW